MAGKDIVIMSKRELKRLHVIQEVLRNNLKQVRASDIIKLSERQIRRVVKRVRKEGEAGIIHKSRGRPVHSN